MSATGTIVELDKADYDAMIDVLNDPMTGSDSFVRWSKAGAPRPDDIGCLHAPNVIGSLERKDGYQRLRNRLMSKYDVSEDELMVLTLTKFAASRR